MWNKDWHRGGFSTNNIGTATEEDIKRTVTTQKERIDRDRKPFTSPFLSTESEIKEGHYIFLKVMQYI